MATSPTEKMFASGIQCGAAQRSTSTEAWVRIARCHHGGSASRSERGQSQPLPKSEQARAEPGATSATPERRRRRATERAKAAAGSRVRRRPAPGIEPGGERGKGAARTDEEREREELREREVRGLGQVGFDCCDDDGVELRPECSRSSSARTRSTAPCDTAGSRSSPRGRRRRGRCGRRGGSRRRRGGRGSRCRPVLVVVEDPLVDRRDARPSSNENRAPDAS